MILFILIIICFTSFNSSFTWILYFPEYLPIKFLHVKETGDSCFSQSGLFQLIWWCPVPSIFCKLFLKYLFYYFVHVSAGLSIFICVTCMLVPVEARRKWWMTWNWSHRQLWTTGCGFWNLNKVCWKKNKGY